MTSNEIPDRQTYNTCWQLGNLCEQIAGGRSVSRRCLGRDQQHRERHECKSDEAHSVGWRNLLGLGSKSTKRPGEAQGLYIRLTDVPLGLTRRSIRNRVGRPEANADHGSSPNSRDIESSWPAVVVCRLLWLPEIDEMP